MRSYSRLVLLAALASGARGAPAKSEITLKEGQVLIHGQAVSPKDHILANENELTILVKVKDTQGSLAALGMGKMAVSMGKATDILVINVDIDKADRIMTKLEANPHIESVEFDSAMNLFPGEKDGDQRRLRRLAEEEPYGIGMVLEDVAWWTSKFGSSPPTGSIKVCVVDTGYGNGHEDLPTLDQNSDGFNPQSSGEWYIDGHSHGSHCAGSIGALGDNSKGVVGVIPNSLSDKFSFFIGKGLSDSGSGSTTSVMAAVQACVDGGSKVISMSLGGGSPSDTVNQQYYGHYKNDDVLIIAAAGNGGNSALSYPASYKSVMSVAAVDSGENKAGFSQFNEQVEIAGPGVSVKSTVTGSSGSTFSYASYSGTSMATPHVAGVAGLLRAYFPDCKAFQIRNAMIVTAKDKGASGCDGNYGHGIVQAKSAYEYLEENPCDLNESFKEPEGGCAEFSCTEDSDCDDGDPGTINSCESGSCQHACANDAACDDGDTCTVDTCTDGVCSNIAPDCSTVVLELTTDNYPSETEWSLEDSLGDEVINGSGYSDANTKHVIPLYCKDEGDEFTFKITDAYGDGICCSYGSGGYVIKGREVDVAGGDFGDSETETFTIQDSTCNPTPPPVTPPVAPPVAPPVNSPTPPPVAPPTNPPVAPPVNSPTPPPVGGDNPVQDTITIDSYKFHFVFSQKDTCVDSNFADGQATGSTKLQCAQACVDLASCIGFVYSGEVCVLYGDEQPLCDDGSEPNAKFYERAAVMKFGNN